MSYTLAYQGAEIDDILARAVPGGAIDQALAAKQDALTFDAVPTEGSTNPAESGGIYDAIQAGGAAALAAFPTDSIRGDVVSFPDGADDIPVKAFTGSILPAQSGSGDPAPDNIRPISGWTGANICRMGVNLFDGQMESGIYSQVDGTPTTSTTAKRTVTPIRVLPSTSYRYVSGGNCRVFYYDKNGNYLSNAVVNAGDAFTTPSNCELLKFQTNNAVDENSTGINYPSTVTTYQPYNGSTILLDFGQTVYAGTLTALGGGLWQVQPTHEMNKLKDHRWTYGTYDGVTCFMASDFTARQAGKNYICSVYPAGDGRSVQYALSPYNSASTSDRLYINDPTYTTADALVAMLTETDATIVFPLKTLPDPITITGEDLQTLLGANTVWTDVGSVTGMTYRADTALYIQKLLNGGGTLQTLSMASPSPSLSLGRVGVLAEPEVAEPEQTEEVGEQPEESEEE